MTLAAQPHVLIIDDEKDFAVTIAGRLELRGLRVSCAFSGEEGLTLMGGDWPELLLLDMRMPGLSGPDVLKILRHEGRFPGGAALPVVIITGYCSDDDARAVEGMGIQGYFQKPLQFKDLMATVNRILQRE